MEPEKKIVFVHGW